MSAETGRGGAYGQERRTWDFANLFAAGDPRRGPFTDEQIVQAHARAAHSARWSRRSGADWLAVRLQVGRGRQLREVEKALGVSQSALLQRRAAEDWMRDAPLLERRELARLVWLGGVIRGLHLKDCAALMAASEWRDIEPEGPLWTPMDTDEWNPDAWPELRPGAGEAAASPQGEIDNERETHDAQRAEQGRAIRERALEALTRLAERVDRRVGGGLDQPAAGVGQAVPDSGGRGADGSDVRRDDG